MEKQHTDRNGDGSPTVSLSQGELQDALCLYILDTLSNVDTVREFTCRLSRWMLERETEVEMMMDIKERADRINLGFDHVKKSEDKLKAIGEYVKSCATQMTADSRREELEKELAYVLKDTLGGLDNLSHFLDAVEKLAVTSLKVFIDNQMLQLPGETSLETVQSAITAAKLVCPFLIQFKRDATAFFFPSLHNVEVLAFQLDKYVRITQKICERMQKSSILHFPEKINNQTLVLAEDLSDDVIQAMYHHIIQLTDLRMDQHFRLAFLFQEDSASEFISEFSQRLPRMQQFLVDLEESAVCLDRMKKGAKISSVAGSSVGAVGGVLSIVGLALAPVTVGASLALTFTGLGLGITSGVNSAITTATEIGVNKTHQKKANEIFQSFMEDVQILQDCLEMASQPDFTLLKGNDIDVALGLGKVAGNVYCIGRGIDSIIDGASAAKLLNNEELFTSTGKTVLQEGKSIRNLPKVASDIPDIGQAAAKGSLALSKTARVGLITLNSLFLGFDIFFIYKDSTYLAKRSESEVSQFIRTRAELWRSELGAWQRIHDSLLQGMTGLETSLRVLEKPFYQVARKEI